LGVLGYFILYEMNAFFNFSKIKTFRLILSNDKRKILQMFLIALEIITFVKNIRDGSKGIN
jgi:hypothetical protein